MEGRRKKNLDIYIVSYMIKLRKYHLAEVSENLCPGLDSVGLKRFKLERNVRVV